jgi:hypothetical protein
MTHGVGNIKKYLNCFLVEINTFYIQKKATLWRGRWGGQL